MSKAGLSRRKKLCFNIFHSDLSASDKMVYYAMHLKYVDGEQLLEFLSTPHTQNEIRKYIGERLEENRFRKCKNDIPDQN